MGVTMKRVSFASAIVMTVLWTVGCHTTPRHGSFASTGPTPGEVACEDGSCSVGDYGATAKPNLAAVPNYEASQGTGAAANYQINGGQGGPLAGYHNRHHVGPQSHLGAMPGPAMGPPAPTVTYPYYTTRGPRDYFLNNPPTIGR